VFIQLKKISDFRYQFHKGKIKWRQSGVVPAKELVRLINENAE
jgi:hypothetical protein